MNMAFGVAIFLAPMVIVLISYLIVKKTKKLSHGFIAFLVGLAVFFSFGTYGPRYELDSTKITGAQYKPEIKAGSELIPEDDRWTHFDETVKNHESRQSNDEKPR